MIKANHQHPQELYIYLTDSKINTVYTIYILVETKRKFTAHINDPVKPEKREKEI